MKIENRFLALVVLLVALLPLTLAAPAVAEELSRETQEHLVAAHAKWGVIKVIFDELYNPEFRGPDNSRSAISYICRHISTIAAPALNRWVIRPERKFLGKEVEASLDNIHSRLEGFDSGIGFSNSTDAAAWGQAAGKFHALIKQGAADAAAIFRALPQPRISLSPDFQREVIRDELDIVRAFLANQDEGHRWTPVANAPVPEEMQRVAVLHSQALHIATAMIEYVLANPSFPPGGAQKLLISIHARLTHEKDTSLRVIRKGDFEWTTMHNTFHQIIDRARNEIQSVSFDL